MSVLFKQEVGEIRKIEIETPGDAEVENGGSHVQNVRQVLAIPVLHAGQNSNRQTLFRVSSGNLLGGSASEQRVLYHNHMSHRTGGESIVNGASRSLILEPNQSVVPIAPPHQDLPQHRRIVNVASASGAAGSSHQYLTSVNGGSGQGGVFSVKGPLPAGLKQLHVIPRHQQIIPHQQVSAASNQPQSSLLKPSSSSSLSIAGTLPCIPSVSILDHSGANRKRARECLNPPNPLLSESSGRATLQLQQRVLIRRTGACGTTPRTDKAAKGLRHFSMRVCEKVRKKGVTTYNEVADELVAELGAAVPDGGFPQGGAASGDMPYDQKNIRRRVYDALNVLMAMGILAKVRKEIHWIGLPTNTAEEVQKMEKEQEERLQRVKLKTQKLHEMLLQQICWKSLIARNQLQEEREGRKPAPSSFVSLPFLLIDTARSTVIDCAISNDKSEYLFNFSSMFQLKDETEILRNMNMGRGIQNGSITEEDLQEILGFMPSAFHTDIIRMAQGQKDVPLPYPYLVPSLQADPLSTQVPLESAGSVEPAPSYSLSAPDGPSTSHGAASVIDDCHVNDFINGDLAGFGSDFEGFESD